MSAVFVTGTGTEIGKTFVTAALIHALRRRGRRVDALKPVVSGFDPTHLAASDSGVLLAALGRKPTAAALDRLSPWRYAAPLSPDMAARRAGEKLDFDALLTFTRREIAAAEDVLLIEGVGGVMVPLDAQHTVLDWIAALDVPVLLVGGSYLGAISHALTALDVLDARGLSLTATIVNETAGSGVSLEETAESIGRFAGDVTIITLPRLASVESVHPALQSVADLL
jgi:dethiobiotin synthetase